MPGLAGLPILLRRRHVDDVRMVILRVGIEGHSGVGAVFAGAEAHFSLMVLGCLFDNFFGGAVNGSGL